MNLYDTYQHIQNATDADVAALHNVLIAEHNRRQANKACFAASDTFLRHMNDTQDYDKLAYDIVNRYVDHSKIKAYSHNTSAIIDYLGIASFLCQTAHDDGITGSTSMIKLFRSKSGKRLAESKYHIDKAWRMIVEGLKGA